MCTPGCNEEGFGYLVSPREESAHEYLLSASRVLQAEELHEKALDPFLLQAEFFVSPSKWPPHLYTCSGPPPSQLGLKCTDPNMEETNTSLSSSPSASCRSFQPLRPDVLTWKVRHMAGVREMIPYVRQTVVLGKVLAGVKGDNTVWQADSGGSGSVSKVVLWKL